MITIIVNNTTKIEKIRDYFLNSIQNFDEKFNDSERYFIMGSDNYKKISTWKESEKLIRDYKYIILDRETGNTKDISASLVREKIKNSETADELIPKQIIEYIKQNNLYR